MSRDATLDRFDDEADGGDAAGGAGADADHPVDAAPESADGAESNGTDGVEPAVSTYRWLPSGQPCATCGERAERLWRDGADLVCASCKPWNGTERGTDVAGREDERDPDAR